VAILNHYQPRLIPLAGAVRIGCVLMRALLGLYHRKSSNQTFRVAGRPLRRCQSMWPYTCTENPASSGFGD